MSGYRIAILAYVIILCMLVFSGCTGESPANNTSQSPGDVKQIDRPNVATSDTVTAVGSVYIEDRIATGAIVEATAMNGSDRVLTNTNDTGAYTLYLNPDLLYVITARYSGLKHSIWPVKGGVEHDYPINLTIQPSSTISGTAQYWGQSGVYIEAVPVDGGEIMTTTTASGGNYSLKVRPGVSYHISGLCFDQFGQSFGVGFNYPGWINVDTVMAAQNETVQVDYCVSYYHGPKGFFLNLSAWPPAKPPEKIVPANGRVYLNGKPVAGATVVAYSQFDNGTVSTVTNDSGSYTLGLKSRTLYNITATHNSLKHSILPVFLRENNTTEYEQFINTYNFDISLTDQPASKIRGLWTGDPGMEWSNIIVEGVPRDSSSLVSATMDDNGNFTLGVKPLVYYNISLKYRDTGELVDRISIVYHTGVSRSIYVVNPNETVLVDYHGYW